MMYTFIFVYINNVYKCSRKIICYVFLAQYIKLYINQVSNVTLWLGYVAPLFGV